MMFFLAASFAAQAADLAQIMADRSFWPKTVTVTEDVNAELYTAKGKRIGKQPLSTGKRFELRGVYKQGVAVKVGTMIAFIRPGATNIEQGITAMRESKALARGLYGVGTAGTTGPAGGAAVAAKPRLSKGMADLIPKELIDASGGKRSHDELAGKYVGIYFSAHWCGPCRSFTPSLVKFRDANTKEFEVVFVSSDRTLNDQKSYMADSGMKWLATAHGSSEASDLKGNFTVRGIPKLVILNPEGKVISENGRGEVSSMGDKALEQWKTL